MHMIEPHRLRQQRQLLARRRSMPAGSTRSSPMRIPDQHFRIGNGLCASLLLRIIVGTLISRLEFMCKVRDRVVHLLLVLLALLCRTLFLISALLLYVRIPFLHTEFSISAEALDELTVFVNQHGDLYDQGLAFGGVNGVAVKNISGEYNIELLS